MRSTESQFELDPSADARRAGIRKHLLLGIWLCLAPAQWAMGQPNMPTYNDITDSSLGMRWHLVVDPSHPERPGRWYRIAMRRDDATRRADRPANGNFVIRPGDKVIVTQRTAEVEARLTAIAIEPARCGERFTARLAAMRDSSTAVVLAQASGPGEAVWVGSKELRP
jgi:hypothetical protein